MCNVCVILFLLDKPPALRKRPLFLRTECSKSLKTLLPCHYRTFYMPARYSQSPRTIPGKCLVLCAAPKNKIVCRLFEMIRSYPHLGIMIRFYKFITVVIGCQVKINATWKVINNSMFVFTQGIIGKYLYNTTNIANSEYFFTEEIKKFQADFLK